MWIMKNSRKNADICLECLGKKNWYAFFAVSNQVVIRRVDDWKYPCGDGIRTCCLDTEDMGCSTDSGYTSTAEGLRRLFRMVKSIPRKCERYCEHFLAEGSE